jgi:hypothetical protein
MKQYATAYEQENRNQDIGIDPSHNRIRPGHKVRNWIAEVTGFT